MISESSNIDEAVSKFPKYLFAEKNVYIQIYKKLNIKKLKQIYINVLKVEKLVRKNQDLYNIIGLRFLINIKKIITF